MNLHDRFVIEVVKQWRKELLDIHGECIVSANKNNDNNKVYDDFWKIANKIDFLADDLLSILDDVKEKP